MYVSSFSLINVEPLSIVLTIIIIHLSFLIFGSNVDLLPFVKEYKYRYDFVIKLLKHSQRLDLATNTENGNYAGSFNTFNGLLKKYRFSVIKQIGTVASALTVIVMEIIYLSIKKNLFPGNYNLYSLQNASLNNGAQFPFPADETENIKVHVFETENRTPFDKNQILKVGSMIEPSNADNRE